MYKYFSTNKTILRGVLDETLEDIIIDLGLENTGGSNGHASIGELAIGQDDFENIFKHFTS